MGLPWGLSSKESACNAGDMGSIPGVGRSPGEGHGNPLQHSCLESPRDRAAQRATVHGVAKESDTTEQLHNSNTYITCPVWETVKLVCPLTWML